MNKRKITWIVTALLCLGVATFVAIDNEYPTAPTGAVTDTEVAAAEKKLGFLHETPTQAVTVPMPMSHPVRLAIGSLGLSNDEMNRDVSDLTLTKLNNASGLELVERQSLNAALHELNLSLSGLVRAKDAVQAGRFVKADWFLLGTKTKIAGTNSLIVRLVDAHSGILRDARVVRADQLETQLALDIAGFVRQSRSNAVTSKPQVYLSIGGFEDSSLNNRQAAFPNQLRGYLLAAYRNSNVNLLEREYVNALLQEMRLDLAGLTDGGATDKLQPIQSAYWFVNGKYQS